MSTADSQADELRSRVYALLGNLLASPPGADLLARLAAIEGNANGDALARAWRDLGRAARQTTGIEALDDEYHDLFIGIAHGELLPYASWYLTGLLMEQPLADLRGDLQQLGIERRTSVSEPEDHAAALCQVMALLSYKPDSGEAAAGYSAQRDFVARHLAPWIKQFFSDLENADSADFYRSVGQLGTAFMDFEGRYLDLDSMPTRNSKQEVNTHERAG